MANKDFRMTAVLAVRDTMSPVLMAASEKWEGFRQDVESTEFKDLQKKIRLANRSLHNFGGQAKEVASKIGMAFAAVAGSVGFSLQNSVMGFAQAGDALDKMGARLGVSTEKLQEWSFAATHAGAAPENLEDALKDLSKNISEVASGKTSDASQLFEALGISVKDAAGNVRSTSAIFNDVADAIQRNEDPAIRTKMAMVLMGDSGRKLIPMLSSGSEGLNEMSDQARKLGLVMSTDATTAAATMTDHMDDMKATVAGLGNDIGYRLSPVVIRVSDRLRDLVAGNREAFSEKFANTASRLAEAVEKIDVEGLANGVLTVADVALRGFNAVGGFNTVLYGMGAILAGKTVMAVVSLGSSLFGLVKSFGAVLTAAKAFGAASTLALGPIGLGIAGISAAVMLLVTNWDSVKNAVSAVSDTVASFLKRFDFDVPDWVKNIGWGGSKEGGSQSQNDGASSSDNGSYADSMRLQPEGMQPAMTPQFVPETGGRMSGQMVVRVAADQGTTAQLVSAQGENLQIRGSIGRSDRSYIGGD